MLSLTKSICMLLCAAMLFSSCYPLSVNNQSRHPLSANAKQVPAAGQLVMRNDVPACSMRQLLKHFPAAENISWQQFDEQGWVAVFTLGRDTTSMNFDARGGWSRIYQRYTEAPADVRTIVAKSFSDYRIISVYGTVSAFDDDHSDYNVVIRNQDHCKVLGLCKGAITVYTELEN